MAVSKNQLQEIDLIYKAIFDKAAEGILVADIETKKFIMANKTICEMLGYSEEELLELSVLEIHPPDRVDYVVSVFEAQARGDYHLGENLPCLRSNGEVFYADINTTKIEFEGREYNVGYFTDITARKEIQDAIEHEKEKAQKYLNVAGMMFIAIGKDEKVSLINRKGCEILECKEEGIIGKNWFDTCIPERERENVRNVFQQLMNGEIEMAEYFENRIQTINGEEKIIAWYNTILHDSNGNITGTLSSGEDITEKSRTQHFLKFMQFAIDRLSEAAFWMDPEGRLIYVNEKACASLGYSRGELLSMHVYDFDPEFPPERWPEHWADIKKKDADSFESTHRTKEGRTFPVEISVNYLEFEGREYNCAFAKDITERKRVEAELIKARDEWETIFNAVGHPTFIMDTEQNLLAANNAMEKLVGIPAEELTGEKCYKILHGRDHTGPPRGCPMKKMMISGGHESFDMEVEVTGGVFFISCTPVYENGEITKVIHIATDITRRKKAEDELHQYRDHLEELVQKRTAELREAQERLIASERLAVLGQFAGSIAHEIRNPLSVISNSSYYISRKLEPDDPKIVHHLEMIRNNVYQTSQIIDSIQNMNLSGMSRIEEVRVRDLVTEVLESIKIPPGINKMLNFNNEPLTTKGDRKQLEIALKNIFKNSVQAMGEEGNLTVECRAAGNKSGSGTGGRPVEIRITDTGDGIDEESLGKIFDPLFTTKTYGIGFGLSIVKSIVEKHSGTVRVSSEDGGGTTFTLRLPG